jgi:hypothetical protein
VRARAQPKPFLIERRALPAKPIVAEVVVVESIDPRRAEEKRRAKWARAIAAQEFQARG